MSLSKAGFILSLIGGILGIVMSLAIGLFSIAFFATEQAIVGVIMLLLGLYGVVTGVLVLLGGVWMRSPRTRKRGAIIALIFGVIGSGGILGLIGGILGLVAKD